MLIIEELNSQLHDRKSFDSGLEEVNAFFQQKAVKQAKQSVNRSWVALDDSLSGSPPHQVVGYFTITNCTVAHSEISGSYPKYPLPAFKLAWFGVDTRYQGSVEHFGEQVLIEALYHTWELWTQTRMNVALLVDPLTPKSEAFFRKYDFEGTGRAFGKQETLYMSLKKIRQIIEDDLLSAAVEKLGSPGKAQRWFNNPCPMCDDRKPRDVVEMPGGLKALEQILYAS